MFIYDLALNEINTRHQIVYSQDSANSKFFINGVQFKGPQDVMERLCASHCKHSPLRKVSDEFIRTHPNPYIDIFERLAAAVIAQSAAIKECAEALARLDVASALA